VDELARNVNSLDALLGVHGAGLTNAVFLPAGAVVIQVVPYGNLERTARIDFGKPVADMGLAYSVTAEESMLLDMLVSSEVTRGRPSSTFLPPPRAPSRPPPPCR
jgi:hypothetical protein